MNPARKYLNPKNDIAFKRIFGRENNKDILITMLNAVLKKQLTKPIAHVEFLGPVKGPPEVVGSKESFVDVLCKDKQGNKYIIELNVSYSAYFEIRARYYAEQAFLSQTKKGAIYEGVKEVIFISFCDFNTFAKKPYYKHIGTILEPNTNERNLDKLSFTFIDLVQFAQQCSKNIKDLTLEEQFYYFLCHASDIKKEEVETIIAHKTIKKAFVELEPSRWSDSEYAYYEAVKKNIWDYVSALAYAREQGIKKGIKEREEEECKKRIKEWREKGIKIGQEEGRKETYAKAVKVLLASGMPKAEVADRLKIPLMELEGMLTKQ